MKRFLTVTLVLTFVLGLSGLTFADQTGDFLSTTIDVGIVVSDIEKAADFYKNAMGFTEVSDFDVPENIGGGSGLTDYLAFHVRVLVLGEETNATQIKLMEFPRAPGKKVDNQFIHSSLGYSYLTILVSDMTAAVERARKAGAIPVKKPYLLPKPNKYLTLFKDPDGNIVELLEPEK